MRAATPEHEPFMRQALAEAEQALAANEFPVGCVLELGGQVLARGRRANSRGPGENELDHAEIMALRQLVSQHPEADRSRLVAYCTMEPCLMCFAALLLNGIRTIVYAFEDAMGGGTAVNLGHITPLYRHLEPAVIPGVLRLESLGLFRRFFNDPANDYWRGSYLAEYTLSL